MVQAFVHFGSLLSHLVWFLKISINVVSIVMREESTYNTSLLLFGITLKTTPQSMVFYNTTPFTINIWTKKRTKQCYRGWRTQPSKSSLLNNWSLKIKKWIFAGTFFPTLKNITSKVRQIFSKEIWACTSRKSRTISKLLEFKHPE